MVKIAVNRRRWLTVAVAPAAMALFTTRPVSAAEPLLVFAAASLADAVTEAGGAWERGGGTPLAYNFAGSNTLAQQIAAGAPAALFLAADEAQMEGAVAAGRVRAGTAVGLLGNRLVVVVPADHGVQLSAAADLLRFPRLAIADPEAVPAGVYARRWLEAQGLWERLAPRVVPALDVRAALAAVAGGHLPAGIVYATDAATSDRVAVAYAVPDGEAPPVRYFAAPVEGRREADAAALLRFLQGPEARRIFVRYGFTVLGAEPPPPTAPAGG